MRWSTICLKTAPLQAALQLAGSFPCGPICLKTMLRAKLRQRIEISRGQIAMRSSRCPAALDIYQQVANSSHLYQQPAASNLRVVFVG